jgi:excisionase family DNA binding protein
MGKGSPHLTRKEAAEYLGMSPKTLENHPKHIPFYKVGGRVLYIKEELDALIRRNRQGGVNHEPPRKEKVLRLGKVEGWAIFPCQLILRVSLPEREVSGRELQGRKPEWHSRG